MEKAWELQQRICQAFEEYFGSTDPVFSNPHLAEEWMNNFLQWYSYLKEVPDKGKTPAQLYAESHGKYPELLKFNFPDELMEAGEIEVGLVFDEKWGIYILPYYGEVKEAFKGDYTEIPDYEELLKALIHKESFIPPFIIKRLIEENPEKALEAYRTIYDDVKSLKDLYKLFKENRKGWEDEPKPSILPVKW